MTTVNESPVKSYLNLERDPVSANHAATKGYIDGQITTLDAAKAAANHTHAAGDITSGTLGSARLPDATASVKGGVIVGAGLSVSSGTVSVDYQTCKTGLGLGSAAYLSTGTGSGNIPVLDGSGKLPASTMPARVVGGENLGEVANQAAMIAQSAATVGDFVKRTDTGTYWMLGVDADGAYATAANWFEYAGAVASVNGKVGAVTQADLGLETTLTVSSDVKFPSSKAVATYVNGQITALNLADTYAAKSHTHTLSDITGASKIHTITGDGSATDFTCTHGLGTANVLVQVYDSSGKLVWVAVEKTSTAVVFKFGAAPAANETFTAVILGVVSAS